MAQLPTDFRVLQEPITAPVTQPDPSHTKKSAGDISPQVLTEIMLQRMWLALDRKQLDLESIQLYLRYYKAYYETLPEAPQYPEPEEWLTEANFNLWLSSFEKCARGSVSKAGHPLSLDVILFKPLQGNFEARVLEMVEQVDWEAENRKIKYSGYNRNRSRRAKGAFTEADVAYEVYMQACTHRKQVVADENAKVKAAWDKYRALKDAEL